MPRMPFHSIRATFVAYPSLIFPSFPRRRESSGQCLAVLSSVIPAQAGIQGTQAPHRQLWSRMPFHAIRATSVAYLSPIFPSFPRRRESRKSMQQRQKSTPGREENRESRTTARSYPRCVATPQAGGSSHAPTDSVHWQREPDADC